MPSWMRSIVVAFSGPVWLRTGSASAASLFVLGFVQLREVNPGPGHGHKWQDAVIGARDEQELDLTKSRVEFHPGHLQLRIIHGQHDARHKRNVFRGDELIAEEFVVTQRRLDRGGNLLPRDLAARAMDDNLRRDLHFAQDLIVDKPAQNGITGEYPDTAGLRRPADQNSLGGDAHGSRSALRQKVRKIDGAAPHDDLTEQWHLGIRGSRRAATHQSSDSCKDQR